MGAGGGDQSLLPRAPFSISRLFSCYLTLHDVLHKIGVEKKGFLQFHGK